MKKRNPKSFDKRLDTIKKRQRKNIEGLCDEYYELLLQNRKHN